MDVTKQIFIDEDGISIMLLFVNPSDSWQVYYRIAGWYYKYGFSLPGFYEPDTVEWIAKVNAKNYTEDLFNE